MNMISSIGNSGTNSPRAMMDKRIDAAVQAGSISATDETALESALDVIDKSLGVGSSSGSQTSKLDPSQVGDRIDDLIDEQVKAGTLTEDQANTLQSLFAQNAPPSGGPGGTSSDGSDETSVDGVGGTGCAGGPRPMGPPPSSSSTSSSSSDEDSTTTAETDQADQLDALIAFLNNMREKMASGNTYGSTASTSASNSTSSGLIVDSYA